MLKNLLFGLVIFSILHAASVKHKSYGFVTESDNYNNYDKLEIVLIPNNLRKKQLRNILKEANKTALYNFAECYDNCCISRGCNSPTVELYCADACN